jgi:hypothetical protein
MLARRKRLHEEVRMEITESRAGESFSDESRRTFLPARSFDGVSGDRDHLSETDPAHRGKAAVGVLSVSLNEWHRHRAS